MLNSSNINTKNRCKNDLRTNKTSAIFKCESTSLSSSDHLIRLWNWDSNTKEFLEDVKSPFKHHTYAVNEVRFSPQGTMLATGSTDGTAAIWDLAVRFFL